MAHLCNDDILSLIFIDTLQNYPPSLLTLRSVNRTWCNVAGRTPQLWTELVLKRRSDFIDLEYPKFYLPKSGALPINVDITLPKDVDVNAIEDVTGLLRDHASRFLSFKLCVQSHVELEAFVRLIGGSKPAPFLEELVPTVRQRDRWSNASEFVFLPTAFTPSPRLTHISLSGCQMPQTFPHLPTITSLTIDDMDAVDKIASCFESTPFLQDFTFEGYDNASYLESISSQFANNPHIVSLPHLLTADVTIGCGAYLLHAIDAPELDFLRLDGRILNYWNPESWEVDVVSRLFSKTIRHLSARSRNLKRMTLEYMELDFPLPDYRLILSSAGFPQLEELNLINTDIDDEALLAASGGPSTLKRLTLVRCERVTGAGLLGFVRIRRSDFCLTLHRCRYIREKVIAELSEIVKVHHI